MKKARNIAFLLAFVCAIPVYAEKTQLHTFTQEEIALLLQKIHKKQKQDNEDRMVHEAKAEIEAVITGFLMAPVAMGFCFWSLLGSIGVNVITSEWLLAITGSQDFATGTGNVASCLFGVGCLYAMYSVVKGMYTIPSPVVSTDCNKQDFS